ncbi:hypothetical protein PMAYCL1PPCAC_31195, partial [Pristionchus mayeri]
VLDVHGIRSILAVRNSQKPPASTRRAQIAISEAANPRFPIQAVLRSHHLASDGSIQGVAVGSQTHLLVVHRIQQVDALLAGLISLICGVPLILCIVVEQKALDAIHVVKRLRITQIQVKIPDLREEAESVEVDEILFKVQDAPAPLSTSDFGQEDENEDGEEQRSTHPGKKMQLIPEAAEDEH